MIFPHATLALLLALIFAAVLAAAFGVRGPWVAPWAVFLVMFLGIWAGGVWITPVGPALYGVYWLPFMLTGLIIGLLVAASSDHRPNASEGAVTQKEATRIGVSTFFWVMVALLILVIFAYYV